MAVIARFRVNVPVELCGHHLIVDLSCHSDLTFGGEARKTSDNPSG
jgi:hypothetical protein